jgi:hypothetical protein
MKTFEEKFTAWIDDQLSDAERTQFEAELPNRAAAHAEKEQAHKLGAFLKEQLKSRAMANEEFFHHQLRGRIAREMPDESETQSLPDLRTTWWSIRRLLWAGATSLAIFVVCTFFVVREKQTQQQSQYLSQILNARDDRAARAINHRFNFPDKKGSGNRALGGWFEIAAIRLRRQIN